MGEGLISKEMKDSLEKIISHCFYANRMLDRMCSILSVTFVMSSTSDAIHHRLAHLYPVLADGVSDYMDSRDCTVIYGETPSGNKDYDTYIDCFNEMLELNLSLEVLVKNSIKLAEDINDYSTKVYLEKYLLEILPITKNILLLLDKAEKYGSNDSGMMKFDHDFESFGFLED